MSVSTKIVVGYSVTLDYDTYQEKVLDEFSQYGEYSNKNVQFFVDGMNGEYIYLVNVKTSVDIEEMYGTIYQNLKKMEDKDCKEMKRLYKELTSNDLNEDDIQLTIFNHVT